MLVRSFVFCFVYSVVGGCISPLEIGPVPYTPRLVVDGLFTDQQGTHYITLSTSAPTHNPDSINRVSGASISLYDDVGNRWNYTEVARGRYQISNAKGETGRTYHIEILLNDGSATYRSTPQRMSGSGEISDISADLKSYKHGPENALTDYFFEVTLNATSDANSEHFLRWRTIGTYEIETHPELATKPDPATGAPVPDPHACSGYIYDPEEGLVQVKECTCCKCWVTEYSPSAVIADNSITENTYNSIMVGTVSIDKFRLFRKYRLQVEQMSLSEDVYRFWQRVKSQEAGESIFQANISKVKGNIYNVADPEDEVFGVFAVSGIATEILIFRRADAPEPLESIEEITTPCYQLIKGATKVKPSFWK
ncbi:MAG TPA: DUF4249 domain-containing protein [Chryseosolibacter sp.]|nr:DUF4249 domain-containing protein [Chryseosolibacter sp.]